MSLGFSEIILIGIFILLVFGSKRIPELARAMGRATHEFKKAKEEISHQGEEFLKAAEKTAELESEKEKQESRT
ncbi:twin-arginine translocase TatA/TatE family subunit [Oxalobacter aliiformigenes]|uniref:Sec-independent protein translocase subunit TatA/TatB n=1 Tax=Oxalobacter aliiformigenes TaxID=2946593 RepID=UPI0022AEFE9B|nr:twin-arginine translocase TatA/TatE family subunit [Oxalobacter aliiformigenes]MCZ4064514.1 twin-arginine translocase TatA/TatE family subunit [Oxalobacter aliiformigenes]WAV99851.1 twin-arginine translocase TatA/TatE family subunit [Oxalobacter aliiformigenes]